MSHMYNNPLDKARAKSARNQCSLDILIDNIFEEFLFTTSQR